MTTRTDSASHGEPHEEIVESAREYIRWVDKLNDGPEAGWMALTDLILELIDPDMWHELEVDGKRPGEPGFNLEMFWFLIHHLLEMDIERCWLVTDGDNARGSFGGNCLAGSEEHAGLVAEGVDHFLHEVQEGDKGNGPGLDMLAEHWSLDVEPVGEGA